MATKVYGISGRTTVEIKLPVGNKAVLPLVFVRGCLDRKNYRPATFSTSDKCVQDMIENSEYFGRTIKLYKVYGKVEAAPAPARKSAPAVEKKTAAPEQKGTMVEEPAAALEESSENVYPDVTTDEEARVVLKSLGAKATQLVDSKTIKKAIKAFGISFPNYK